MIGGLAVLAGAAFLWVAGALPGMVTRNFAAFVVGLAIGFGALWLSRRPWGFPLLLAVASLLLMLTLIGVEADGVRRWIQLGPITLQPALFAVPMLLALLGREEKRKWLPWLVIPAAVLALQPDAASLGALAVGIAMTLHRTHRPLTLAATAVVAALALLLLTALVTPPPVAFIEGTAELAWNSGPAATALHLMAILLMAAAPLSARSHSGWSVAAYFLASAVIAILWAFPMPIAGAAPSHLLGFGSAMAILAGMRRGKSEA